MFEWINPWITGSISVALAVVLVYLIIRENKKSDEKWAYKIYMAGPEVFLSNAKEVGQHRSVMVGLKGLSKSIHLEGLFPLDNEVEPSSSEPATADIIFGGNVAMMESADFIVANMMAFQGPSMDVGTAFEMGYMSHSRKPVFGYYDASDFPVVMNKFDLKHTHMERVQKLNGLSSITTEYPEGVNIEDFGLSDNLMMACAVRRTGYPIATSFEEAIENVIDYVERKNY